MIPVTRFVGEKDTDPSRVATYAELTALEQEIDAQASNTARVYATRSALAAVSAASGVVAFLVEYPRQGDFRFDSSDLSAEVAADPRQGQYVAPNGEDGSSGAWTRITKEVNARFWGAVPDGVTDSYQALRDAETAAGHDGLWKIDPGVYHLSEAVETRFSGQTIVVEGVKLNHSLVKLNRSTNFVGSLAFTSVGSVVQGGPWKYFITRFGQNATLDINVEDVAGVGFTAGGFPGVSGVAEFKSLDVHCENVGIGQSLSVGDGGLIGYIKKSELATYSPGTITNAGDGSYRDGRYITPLRTLTGSGAGAVAGIRVSGGVVVEFEILESGSAYATGDTVGLGLPADSRSFEWHDEPLFVKQTMNAAFDTKAAEYRTALNNNSLDSYASAVVAIKAELDVLRSNEIGSGFVFTVSDTSGGGGTWFNSNRKCSFSTLGASFAGCVSSGPANYNNISLYAEAVHSGYRANVVMEGVSSRFNILNVLINSSYQTAFPDTMLVDFSGQYGLNASGGRIVNPFLDPNQDANWESTLFNPGTDATIDAVELSCGGDNTRGEIRFNRVIVDDLVFRDDPNTAFRGMVGESNVLPTVGFSAIPQATFSSAVSTASGNTTGHVLIVPVGQLGASYTSLDVVIHARRSLGNATAADDQGVIHLSAAITRPTDAANARLVLQSNGKKAWVDENASGLDANGDLRLVIDSIEFCGALLVAGSYYTTSSAKMTTAASVAVDSTTRLIRKINGSWQVDTNGLDRFVDKAAYNALVSGIAATVADAKEGRTLTAFGLVADSTGATSDIWQAVQAGSAAQWVRYVDDLDRSVDATGAAYTLLTTHFGKLIEVDDSVTLPVLTSAYRGRRVDFINLDTAAITPALNSNVTLTGATEIPVDKAASLLVISADGTNTTYRMIA